MYVCACSGLIDLVKLCSIHIKIDSCRRIDLSAIQLLVELVAAAGDKRRSFYRRIQNVEFESVPVSTCRHLWLPSDFCNIQLHK